ncbi:hypothetical protein V6N11_014127 [Hibiscus sabdariffa]|uniref:Uncharacterized protein n=1 Tax=Hibiscus sabdariffa TaxID=183260 RepID=A0ABR2AFU0_9ROSI
MPPACFKFECPRFRIWGTKGRSWPPIFMPRMGLMLETVRYKLRALRFLKLVSSWPATLPDSWIKNICLARRSQELFSGRLPVPIRKESSTVKGFLDWYYWLVHLLGGTTPTYSVLRPYYPVLETELRHIPSLLRVWFGFSFCRCFSRSKYQAGAFFPAVSDIAMASKQANSLVGVPAIVVSPLGLPFAFILSAVGCFVAGWMACFRASG